MSSCLYGPLIVRFKFCLSQNERKATDNVDRDRETVEPEFPHYLELQPDRVKTEENIYSEISDVVEADTDTPGGELVGMLRINSKTV